MIANRYFTRDYRTLEKVGIALEENLFTLENMLAQFEEKKDEVVATLILEDYIHIAKDGDKINIEISKNALHYSYLNTRPWWSNIRSRDRIMWPSPSKRH